MSHYDIDLVWQAASARWPEIISQLGKVDISLLDGSTREHPCPRCGGDTRFRMIDVQAGALFCNHCFKTKNGDGFAALQWLMGWDFGEALSQVAEYVGVAPDKEKKKTDPAEHLEWQEWNDTLVEIWCESKPPIKPEAIKAVGGRIARYRKKHIVIAIPIRNKSGNDCGYVLYSISPGGTLPKFNKQGTKPDWVKVKVTHGSRPGIVGKV